MKNNWSIELLVILSLIVPTRSVIAIDKKEQISALVSGNTVLIGNKYGPSNLYFDPSGEFTHSSPEGASSRGTWRAVENSICVTTEPSTQGKVFAEICMDFSNRKLNETWKTHDPKNGEIWFKLIEGNPRK